MRNLMGIDFNSDFAKAIRELFILTRPTKLIETGTYLGIGSTAIIAMLLKELKIEAQFFSIEVNPEYCAVALNNLKRLRLLEYVELYNGLSIRRELLPSPKQIYREFVEKEWPSNVYIDYNADVRVDRYFGETDFLGNDGLLEHCLKKFDYQPDFVLLDSGGHIGRQEFLTLLANVKTPCVVALDDIFHVKHFENYQFINQNPKFDIYKVSPEKFGFCIAFYYPKRMYGKA